MNTAWEQQKKKVWGQTPFESPTHSHVLLSSPKHCAQKPTFFLIVNKSLTLVILAEKMRGENGDRETDEWILARDREGHRDREERWTTGSLWSNGRLIWNRFEVPVQVKATIYITVPDYSSPLINYFVCSLGKKRLAQRRRQDIENW